MYVQSWFANPAKLEKKKKKRRIVEIVDRLFQLSTQHIANALVMILRTSR